MSTVLPILDAEKNQSNPVKYITVFVFNNPDGIGDFKHGVDIYTELTKQYKGTDTKIKLIALIDSQKSEIASHVIEKDLQQQVYFNSLTHPEQVKKEEHKKNIILLTDWSPDEKDKNRLKEMVTRGINNSPELSHHLQNTDFYLNVSVEIDYNRYLLDFVKPKCFQYSICEYGPMETKKLSGLQPLPIAECSLGFRRTDAGIKFDEEIWEQAKSTINDQHKLALLTNIENKKLLLLLQKNNQPDTSSTRDNYFTDHFLSIGYVQNQQACNYFIAGSIDSCQNKNKIDIIIPHKFIDDELLINLLKEKNIASLVKIKQDGTEQIIQISDNKNGKVCRCIDYQGLNEHDRKILSITANIIAGSGDNSFSDALSNPNALPIFQLSKWKKHFYESFLDYMRSHSDGSAEYQLLIEYLSTMGITDEKHHLNIHTFDNLVIHHHDTILKKWKEVFDILHKDLNFNNNLKSLKLASEIYAQINNGVPTDTIISNFNLEQLLKSDNIFDHRALLVAAVSNNHRQLVEYMCNKLESLPPLSDKSSLTEYALLNGWDDVVNILLEKDFVFLSDLARANMSEVVNNKPGIINYFNHHQNVNIALMHLHSLQSLQDRVTIVLNKSSSWLDKAPWLKSKLMQTLQYCKTFPSSHDSTPILTEYMKNFHILIKDYSILCCKNDNYFQISLSHNMINREPIPQPTLELFQDLVDSWKARELAEYNGAYIPSIVDLVNNANHPVFSHSQKLSAVVSLIANELTQLNSNPSMEDEQVNKEICLKLLLSLCYFNQNHYDLLKIQLTNLESVNHIAYQIFQIALEENATDVMKNLIYANFNLSDDQRNQALDSLLSNNKFDYICGLCTLSPAFIIPLFEKLNSNPHYIEPMVLESLLSGTFNLIRNNLSHANINITSIIDISQIIMKPSNFDKILEVANDGKIISILNLATLSSSDTLKLLNESVSKYRGAWEDFTKTLFKENRLETLKYLISKLNDEDTNTLCNSLSMSSDIVKHIRSFNSPTISPKLRAHTYLNTSDNKKPSPETTSLMNLGEKSSNEQPSPDESSSLRPPKFK